VYLDILYQFWLKHLWSITPLLENLMTVGSFLRIFSLLGKLAERAIYRPIFCECFFLVGLHFVMPIINDDWLMIDWSLLFIFFCRLSNTCFSEANGPIFTKITGLVDRLKGLLTSVSICDPLINLAMAAN